MEARVIYIKNMVCRRCIMAVEELLRRLGYTVVEVNLGSAEVKEPIDAAGLARIKAELQAIGFELIDDRRMRMVEQVKNAVVELVHYQDETPRTNLSDYIADKCRLDYGTLSRLFTEMAGVSIEKYYIAQRVERVKELLAYGELSVSEIAYKLHYSSAAHLSSQFRSVTGMSPRAFRELGSRQRLPLDQI